MNLLNQPIHQKPEKHGKDPQYLALVGSLPCCICSEWGMTQNGPDTDWLSWVEAQL